MTSEERLELLRKIGNAHNANETPETRLKRLREKILCAERLVRVDVTKTGVEINSKNHNEVAVVEATILEALPVSHSEIKETVDEELPAYREAQRDEETASEAITSDER
jgi:hypothetical protein